jgi:putative tricarboxylic transport membrane protein
MVRSCARRENRSLSEVKKSLARPMRRLTIAASLILGGLAVLILFEASRLAFGSIRVPQTGFFPSILAILLLFLSIALLVQTCRQAGGESGEQPITSEAWIRISITLAAMLGFALVLEKLGFLLSTFSAMLVLLRVIEPQKWPRVIVVALATALISYFLFARLLNIPLPAGVLEI